MGGETYPNNAPMNCSTRAASRWASWQWSRRGTFPIAIPAWKIAPALIYGNTVVFKPAKQAS
jgi:hypothetical protein